MNLPLESELRFFWNQNRHSTYSNFSPQAQMPSCVELPEDTSAAAAAQQCPYFSFTSLEDVVQTARESNFGGNSNRAAASAASNVVSVGVDLSSLSRY